MPQKTILEVQAEIQLNLNNIIEKSDQEEVRAWAEEVKSDLANTGATFGAERYKRRGVAMNRLTLRNQLLEKKVKRMAGLLFAIREKTWLADTV